MITSKNSGIHVENIRDTEGLAMVSWLISKIIRSLPPDRVTESMKDGVGELAGYINGLARIGTATGEEKVCAVFDHFALNSHFEELPAILGCGIISMRKEVKIGSGYVDRLIVLEDGTAVVVEIKGPGSRRDHACGLGQVILYATEIRDSYADVKMVLCCGGDKDKWVASACRAAGVEYMNIPACAIDVLCDYSKVVAEWQIKL